ncbi:unnamed protein product [Rhizophagus irregularis]|nr:unnamed protein product [Rhizophagus irregularis]CAB5377385.1 unnamed protein product [Rhizophagus irregularis]
MHIKSRTLAYDNIKILSILNNIVKDEGNQLVEPDFSGYPVYIGSRAAKWHVPSFREPNNWNFIATVSQSILLINKFMNKKNLKLIYYSDVGLKIIGRCVESYENEKYIGFEIELASDKVNLRKMKLMEVTNDMEINDKDNIDDDRSIEDESKIKFEKFDYDQEREQSKSSAQMILELCHNVKDRMMIPFPCIVAPLKVLEALKASHIYWSDDFYKNIADLHSLRIILENNQISPTKPLCCPMRDEKTNLMLKTRIKETEILRGTPSVHINLNNSDEEFLDREDDFFVDRVVPHDKLHELVKYGDHPIYEGLKNDKSKAMIEKSFFQKLDYQKQLDCMKEEAMVIALERYLIPKILKDQETSYSSALIRICTSLTKDWFRQFAIDNYPRLSNLDKDLLSIVHNLTKNNPPSHHELAETITLLHKWILDPEIRTIFEPIYACTSRIYDLDTPSVSQGMRLETYRSGIKINSPVNKNVSIAAIITTVCMDDYEDCNPGADWWASIAILPSEDLKCSSDEYDRETLGSYYDSLHLHPFDHNIIGNRGIYIDQPRAKRLELTSKHILTLEIGSKTSGDSWSVAEDVWYLPKIRAKSADHIASKLEIPNFTGDILVKYVLAYLQPTFKKKGDTPLKYLINKLKATEIIPIKPQQHLWYDAWNYTLKNGGEI